MRSLLFILLTALPAAAADGPVFYRSFDRGTVRDALTGSDRDLPAGKQTPAAVSLWFKPGGGDRPQVLFCYGAMQRGRARGIWLPRPGTLSFFHWGTPDLAVDTGGITPGAWHHVAAVYDGRGTMRLYLDGKKIGERAGTPTVVASFSPGHGRTEHAGFITIVDPRGGPDARRNARRISRGRQLYRDPYPLREDLFLVAGETDILLMDGAGRTTRLFGLPAGWRKGRMKVHEPRPLRGRERERAVPSRVDYSRGTGTVVLENVYVGRNMAGVTPGEIKRLLVLDVLPKPCNLFSGMEPLSYGGTFLLERILGTVPVEPDGSANMRLPAMRPLFFVAQDAAGMSVKRMQSFLTLQPGEKASCLGCHEKRGETPKAERTLMAMDRPPSRIRPVDGAPDVFDFPRDTRSCD